MELGEQRASRQAGLAEVNLRIRETARNSLGAEQEWEFFCECGSDECRANVRLTLDAYTALHDDGCVVLAPGHQFDLLEQAKGLREESRALRAEAAQIRRSHRRRRMRGRRAGTLDTLGRVLVVDDHDLVRRTAGEVVLATTGLRLIGVAASGEQAIQAVAELEPDLILLDVRMPGLNGIEVARIIRDTNPNVVVALFSADPWGLQADADSAGAVALLDKADLSAEALDALWLEHRPRD